MPDIEALTPRRSTMPESPNDERLGQLRPELHLMLERGRRISRMLQPLAKHDCEICEGAGYVLCRVCWQSSGFYWDPCGQCGRYAEEARDYGMQSHGREFRGVILEQTSDGMAPRLCTVCDGKWGKWSKCDCHAKAGISFECMFCIPEDILEAASEKIKLQLEQVTSLPTELIGEDGGREDVFGELETRRGGFRVVQGSLYRVRVVEGHLDRLQDLEEGEVPQPSRTVRFATPLTPDDIARRHSGRLWRQVLPHRPHS
jgi:hypothetical protein